MKEVKKKAYKAPKLTTASFKAERGYLISGENMRLINDNGGSNEPMESFSEQSGWGRGEGFWD